MGGTAYGAATCSRANLTRCLDSACAINQSSNAAARCQYCGTATAGTPSSKNAMRNVSVGASAKYNISDKDLKKAPEDPGERYAWATKLCLQKLTACTTDDVSETYDPLIEQSCKAAGVSAKMSQSITKAGKKKSKNACTSEIQGCLIADNRCTPDFRQCESDADFNKYFAECSVSASGCDDHISAIRDEMDNERNSAVKNADTLLKQIVESYTSAREKKMADIKSGCADNSAQDNCVKNVCERNMPQKCTTNTEKSAAIELCKFYKIACDTID